MKVRRISRNAARRLAREAGYAITGLLAKPHDNPKVAKNLKRGVLTAPMHLAPANLSGYEVCPMRSPGCSAACLHTAGNPAYKRGKEAARRTRTQLYFEDRPLFMAWLIADIRALQEKAHDAGMTPGVRLNATSDIPWERVGFTYEGIRYANLMELFPRVQFYDYTKRANRRNVPENYHLTFSLAEDNDAQALEALQGGMNVAVVFDTRRGQPLPPGVAWSHAGKLEARWGNYVAPVIDGDEHDFRPIDNFNLSGGVIVGLRAKGDAIGDTSGFVRKAA